MTDFDGNNRKLSAPGAGPQAPLQRALGRIFGIAIGAAMVVAAFMASVLVLAVLAGIGLVVWAYLWWRTRDLRRQMRQRPPTGRVIEGEATRESGFRDDSTP